MEDKIKFENGPRFSLNDFKKWMAGQMDKPSKKTQEHNYSNLIGTQVESKIGAKRLSRKMIVDEGDEQELAEDFVKNGGLVLDADCEGNLLIGVDAGSFTMPKYFVKKA